MKYISTVEMSNNITVNSSKPTPVLFEEYLEVPKIKMIDQGKTFSIALDTNGDVYSWGTGVRGELGLTDEQIQIHHVKLHDTSTSSARNVSPRKNKFNYKKYKTYSEEPSVYLFHYIPCV